LFLFSQICSDEITQGEWVDIDLQGQSRFPHAFIGTMAAVMRECENENERPSTSVQDALKTMAVLEAAWQSSTKNMTPIQYN
jgi:predicted dehydrogenase